jgi:hypothetical protein
MNIQLKIFYKYYKNINNLKIINKYPKRKIYYNNRKINICTKKFVETVIIRYFVKKIIQNKRIGYQTYILPFTFYNNYIYINWNKIRVILYKNIDEKTLQYTSSTLLNIDIDSLLLEYI